MKTPLVKAVKGMQDIFPAEAARWVGVETLAREIGRRYAYGEIRTPMVEATSLFVRGIGEGTDIVDKEMFSFSDAAKKNLSLRPEGTAGVVRAYIENRVYAQEAWSRYFYLGPMFRRERPQAGRRRQFNQFGVEALGSGNPALDAEQIDFLVFFLQTSGINDAWVGINTVGCPECRSRYRDVLKDWLSNRSDSLCPDCLRRLERNVLRVLDCKNSSCRRVVESSPVLLDSVCAECRQHFDRVISFLNDLNLSYRLQPRLVRGLDYYTRTVFEVYSSSLGAQDALAAGGRYDNLVEELGGPARPAIGFSVGLERLLICLEQKDIPTPSSRVSSVYCASLGENAFKANFILASCLRKSGCQVMLDYGGRSLKAQMREANRVGVDYVVIRGDEELSAHRLKIKNMSEGGEEFLPDDPEIIMAFLSGSHST